jgi:hypothetical protein
VNPWEAVSLFVLILLTGIFIPVVVYFSCKLGSYAYHVGKLRFEQDKARGRLNDAFRTRKT